jgi:hypothetical protein
MNRCWNFQIERAVYWEPPPGMGWVQGVALSGPGNFDSKIWIRRRRMEWSAS